jgi:hypothetical protein
MRVRMTVSVATVLVALLSGIRVFATPEASASRKRGPRVSENAPLALIALSDSLGHGTMDAVNNEINTRHAFVQLIADRLGAHHSLYFSQPFFNEQEKRLQPFRIPTNLSVDGSDSFSLEGLRYGKRAGVDDSLLSNDLLGNAVLPRLMKDKYDKVLYPLNLFARAPVSQLDSAIWLLNQAVPSAGVPDAAVILWIGNNDSSSASLGYGGSAPEFQPIPLDVVGPELKPLLRALLRFGERTGEVSFEPYLQSTIERQLTSLDHFAEQYEHLLTRLLSETAASPVSRMIFACTLPYYSSVGYLMDSEDLEFYLRKYDPAYTVPPSFRRVADPGDPIIDPLKGDRISLLTFGLMLALLSEGHSADFVNQVLEAGGGQRDGMVLSEEEQEFIRDRIDGFNGVIADVAAANPSSVRLVPIGGLLNDVLTGVIEVMVGGRKFDRKWSRGGAFTLDGVHPGYTGQAFVANYLLAEIDSAMGFTSAPYDLETVALTDPYVDRDGDGWVPGPSYQPTGTSEILFLLTDADDTDASAGADLPADVWDRISDILLERVLDIPALRAEAERIRARR